MNERQRIVELLESDLYRRQDEQEDYGKDQMTWVSPLGWKVKIADTTRDIPLVTIIRPSGSVHTEARCMTADELDSLLP